jgi:hypothetical protein
MAEEIRNLYKRLLEIRLLHHYWLDEGATMFDLIADQAKKDGRLLSYDRRPFLTLAPTATTAQLIDGLGAVFKNTAWGGVAAVPETAEVPATAVFEFVVTMADPALAGYTALTLPPEKIYELYHQVEKKTYRYKENVPVLSNLTGAVRGAGAAKTLYLSREIPGLAVDDRVEALVVAGGALMQLTSDQPNAEVQQLAAQATDVPVFVHQGDIPVITPPAGLAGAPAKGIQLSGNIPDNVFALIRLESRRPDDEDFSLIDGNGHAKAVGPVFQVRFKNRSTLWRYFNKSTGAVVSTEAQPLPLTHFGNAGTKQKPSEGLVKAETSGGKITRLVSEIFV